MVPNVQDTPINNAQVALPKALSKEKGLRKTTIEEFFGEGHLSGVPNVSKLNFSLVISAIFFFLLLLLYYMYYRATTK